MAFTPAQRGPALGDERVFSGARERDPVLREVGHTTENIRTTGVVDVTAGNSGFYDFGAVDQKSIGRYNVRSQEAASVTADGLGTYLWIQFDIHEETAGVFEAVAADEPGGVLWRSSATMAAVADAALDGSTPDAEVTFFVATAADVTDAAAWTAGKVLVLGNLYMLDAIAVNHQTAVKRLS